MPDSRATEHERLILSALARYTLRSGSQLREMTGLGVAVLYPALQSLESSGRITSEWEDMPPSRRRRYQIASAALAVKEP